MARVIRLKYGVSMCVAEMMVHGVCESHSGNNTADLVDSRPGRAYTTEHRHMWKSMQDMNEGLGKL